MMKRYKYFMYFLFGIALLIINLIVFFRIKWLRTIIEEEKEKRMEREWTMSDALSSVGSKIHANSMPTGRHIILRYDMTSCMPCVNDAEALLEDVFGRDFLLKELILVGMEGIESQFSSVFPLVNMQDAFLPTDSIYTPYVCFINDDGWILFSLTLQPEKYDYNKQVLSKIKKSLHW